MYTGPHIPQEDLKVYLDVTNPDCYQANNITDPIANDTLLYNLADKSFSEYFYNINNTEEYQKTTFPTTGSNSSLIVMQHNAFEGDTNRDTTWFSATSVPRVLTYSFVSWYKFDNVSQQNENIYGGGFNGRLSFYMSSGGTSANSYVLLYSSTGSPNGWTAGMGNTINDGNWHMRSYCVTGPSTGVTTCTTYIDGEYYGVYTSNSSYVADTSNRNMTWGSWTNGYGNMAGQLNGLMYYERELSAGEHKLIYNSTKNKYGI